MKIFGPVCISALLMLTGGGFASEDSSSVLSKKSRNSSSDNNNNNILERSRLVTAEVEITTETSVGSSSSSSSSTSLDGSEPTVSEDSITAATTETSSVESSSDNANSSVSEDTTLEDEKDSVEDFHKEEHPEDHGGFRRETVKAHWTLEGIDTNTPLTDGETLFFEHALRKAVIFSQNQPRNSDDEEDELQLGAVLVENGHGEHKNQDDRSLLRGTNTRTSNGSPLNIWAVLEASFRCSSCAEFREHYLNNKYFAPIHRWSPFPIPSKGSPAWNKIKYYNNDDDGDDDYLYSFQGSRYGGRYGGRRRMLRKADEKGRLEDMLCELLREGPVERFQSVTECSLEVSDW